MPAEVQTILRFLHSLYGEDDLENQHLLIWTPNMRSRWFTSFDQAAQYAAQVNGAHDAYFGVGLSRVQKSERERAVLEEIAAVPGLWLDVDVAGPGHSKGNLPATKEEALDLLGAIPYEPTLVVWTGGGLHAYWLYKEPLDTTSDLLLQEQAARSLAFQRLFQKEAGKKGWSLDSTFDLTRVLRLPGTRNHKYAPEHVEAFILEENPTRRYNPETFDEILPAGFLDMDEGARVRFSDNPLAIVPRRGHTQHSLKFDVLFEESASFRDSWLKNPRASFEDGSMSAYDASLASIAARAGLDAQEIADIIVDFRFTHGVTSKDHMKALNVGYLNRTIKFALDAAAKDERRRETEERLAEEERERARAKAREERAQARKGKVVVEPVPDLRDDIVASDEAVAEVLAASGLPEPPTGKEPSPFPPAKTRKKKEPAEKKPAGAEPDEAEADGDDTGAQDEGDRPAGDGQDSAYLEDLNALIGLDFEWIKKYPRTPPDFAFKLRDRHEIMVLTGSVAFSTAAKFRLALADTFSVAMPRIKTQTWDERIFPLILQVATLEPVSSEETDSGYLCALARAYLEENPPEVDWIQQALVHKPFYRGEAVWMTIAGLSEWMARNGYRGGDTRELARLYRVVFGERSKTFTFRMNEYGTTSRSCYRVPEEIYPTERLRLKLRRAIVGGHDMEAAASE